MTETIEQTQEKKGFIRRGYEGFKGLNKTLKIGTIGYFIGFGIVIGSITSKVIREIPLELREYNRLENELSPLSNKNVTFQDLLNDKYVDSLRTAIKNIKAKKDSLESLSSFNETKEDSERLDSFLLYLGIGGISVMGGSIPPIIIGSARKRMKKKGDD